MIKEIKAMIHNGKQYIPDLYAVKLRPPYRGRPVISSAKVDEKALAAVCPLGAITTDPVTIDLGKCAFCGECAFAFPDKISFTQDYRICSNKRANLIVKEGDNSVITFDEKSIRKEIRKVFGHSLKLRQVSAGGDNSCENELNAAGNANFDMSRYGIEFTASPRHADGIVVTGPITQNMAEPLRIAYDAIPEPKIFVLCGVDAISGGVFRESGAINRSILNDIDVDLYIPGNPSHPLTIVTGILDLTRPNTANSQNVSK